MMTLGLIVRLLAAIAGAVSVALVVGYGLGLLAEVVIPGGSTPPSPWMAVLALALGGLVPLMHRWAQLMEADTWVSF
jgi:hypothetical protein